MGMGIDPPKSGETHIVTIEVKGPLTKEEFDKYQRALKNCLSELKRRWRARRGIVSLKIPPKWRRGTVQTKRKARKRK